MPKKLYVGNLPFSVDDQGLNEMFASYGEIASVRVVTDRETGRSKGFGFVEFAADDAADSAINALNGQSVGGRPLTVSEARPQEPRGDRGGRGGGFRGGRGGGGGGGGFRGDRGGDRGDRGGWGR